jgi:hypothetical protein
MKLLSQNSYINNRIIFAFKRLLINYEKAKSSNTNEFGKALEMKVNEAYRSFLEKERQLESLRKEVIKASKVKEIILDKPDMLHFLGL